MATLPVGPDRTLALRKLQDAMMSANACLANAQTEDEPPVYLGRVLNESRPGEGPPLPPLDSDQIRKGA
jgi:hypothetical protein